MSLNFLEFTGAFTALITPFSDDGTVDIDALRSLTRRQIDAGISGLVPCGTTGEAATMDERERLQVIETVADEAGDEVSVIAGTGTNDTRASIEFSRRVAHIDGVDAALVVTPYYNKPGQPELLRHFQEIADEGGIPVVLYNVPSRTGVSLSVDTVAKLADHGAIVGIKEASADLAYDSDIRNRTDDDFALLSGDDFTTFPLMTIGGQGCVSVVSNLIPSTMSKMCAAVLEGDLQTAREIHLSIQPLAQTLFAKSNPIPVKTAAHLMGLCGPTLRGPLYEPDDEFKEVLAQALEAHGLT